MLFMVCKPMTKAQLEAEAERQLYADSREHSVKMILPAIMV